MARSLRSGRACLDPRRSGGYDVLQKSYRRQGMAMTVLSTKGQVIIPKEIRERHGWRPGTVLEIVEHGDSIVIRAHEEVPRTTLDDVLGCLRYRGPAKTLA